MMSIRTMASSDVDSIKSIASLPVVAVNTFMPRRSNTLLSAKILRESSSTNSAVRPIKSSSELLSLSSMRCLSDGRSVITRCKNKAVSSSRRSGDSTPLTTMLRHGVDLRILLSGQFPPGKHHDGDVGERRVSAHLLQYLKSAHI